MRSLRIYIAWAPLLNTEFGGNCTIRDFEVTAGLWPANGGDRNIGNLADQGGGGRAFENTKLDLHAAITRPLVFAFIFDDVRKLSLSLSFSLGLLTPRVHHTSFS